MTRLLSRGMMIALALVSLGAPGCTGTAAAPAPAATAAEGLALERVAIGLDKPVHLTSPPGDARLFVVEQTGRIRIVERGTLLPRPFLDLSGRVSGGSEQGLLSVAFHPRYAANGWFFVYYTDTRGDVQIRRYRVSGDPAVADPGSATPILTVPQPYSNHNGGLALFGPDGMLYLGLGDGGSGGDPHRHGENLGTLLGKLLRIDVDHGVPYTIPRDNPFRGRSGARPEIWAYGLRNPWRFSFDPPAALLFIGDVGQNRWEEIDVVPADSAGLHYGWSRMEGSHCFRARVCNPLGTVLPAVEYPRAQGCTVIGGIVYRGRRFPRLTGHYFYSDYCHGWLRSFRWSNGKPIEHLEWKIDQDLSPSSFGTDAAGELYVLSLEGSVHRIIDRRAATGTSPRR
jgi:glucose/arabinose dehydrogenase